MARRATKADAERALRQAYGPDARLVPQRTLWGAWTVRAVDTSRSPIESGHVLFVTSDYGAIGLAYGDVLVRCRSRSSVPTTTGDHHR